MNSDNFSKYCQTVAEKLIPGDIVFIGGLSKTGKTTFSNNLNLICQKKNLNAIIISIDRWIKSKEDRLPGVIGRYDLTELSKVLLRRISGEQDDILLELPDYDKITMRRVNTGNIICIRKTDVLIIEGTISLTMSECKASTHCYYLQIDEFVRRLRVIKEYLSRGYSEKDAQRIYEQRQLDEFPIIVESSKYAVKFDIT